MAQTEPSRKIPALKGYYTGILKPIHVAKTTKTGSVNILKVRETAIEFIDMFKVIKDIDSETYYQWNESHYVQVNTIALLDTIETCIDDKYEFSRSQLTDFRNKVLALIPQADWIEQSSKIYCNNGYYDIETDTVYKTTADHHIRYVVNVNLPDTITSNEVPASFTKILNNIYPLTGDFTNDTTILANRALALNAIALALMPKTWRTTKHFVLLTGESNTGKSTFIDLCSTFWYNGKYIDHTSMENLMEPHGTSSLVGKRLLTVHENTKFPQKFDGLLKALSECSVITINPKNLKPYTYENYILTMYFAFNNSPQLPTDSGLWSRIVHLPFNNVIREKDPNILIKLEEDRDQLFLGLLPIIKELYANKCQFEKPDPTTIEDTFTMQREKVLYTITEMFQIVESPRVTNTTDVCYTDYKKHVYSNGGIPCSKREFTKQMRNIGAKDKVTTIQGKSARIYTNVEKVDPNQATL